MTPFQRLAAAVATVARPVVASSWGRRLLGGTLAVITYRGRRSGTVRSLVVGYEREGDEVRLGVAFPDRKTWWRNFTGEGHPLTIRLDGVDRTGHAVARRGDDGLVHLTVRLDPA